MHILTSSIFLSAFIPHLSLGTRRIFLHYYLLVALGAGLLAGRPILSARSLMSFDPSPPVPAHEPIPSARPGAKDQELFDAPSDTGTTGRVSSRAPCITQVRFRKQVRAHFSHRSSIGFSPLDLLPLECYCKLFIPNPIYSSQTRSIRSTSVYSLHSRRILVHSETIFSENHIFRPIPVFI